MKYAENTGHTRKHHINFGVNGERRVWKGRLARLNGQVIGHAKSGGKVKVFVTANPDGNRSYWIRGTLTLKSLSGPLFPGKGIQVFAMGADTQFLVDDVCIKH